jgi:hypothetical protein
MAAVFVGFCLVEMEQIVGSRSFVCPLCKASVGRRGCADCHLSAADILRHAGGRGRWSEPWGRGLWSRLVGVIVYGGLVAWSWYYMPSTFLFVLPGAIVGVYMQTVRARPLLGAVLFVMIVVVVPALVWPAGLTGDFTELSRRL